MQEDTPRPPKGSFSALQMAGRQRPAGEKRRRAAPPMEDSPITILSRADLEDLRFPGYQTHQTFRMAAADVQWLKDTAFELSKQVGRRKATQADIVHVALKLFARAAQEHPAEVIDVLKVIK